MAFWMEIPSGFACGAGLRHGRPGDKASLVSVVSLVTHCLLRPPAEICAGGGRRNMGGLTMKKLVFAIGVLALGLTASVPARADFAIVKFNSGYCRIWRDTAVAPPDGHFLWWHWGWHWYYRLPTWPIAEHKLHKAVYWHRCTHWWG